jgi:PAS domain S-box-containing protein
MKQSKKRLRFSKIMRGVSRKQVEEKKFESLLESAPDAMIIVNGRGEIVLANGQTEKLFGYQREELAGKPVELLIPERFRTRHREHRNSFSKNMRPRPMGIGIELYAVRKNGSEFPVDISLSPVETEEDTLVISAIRDITERKEVEARLQEKERLATLGTIASVFAHEIANPLNGIATSLEIAAGLLETSDNRDPLLHDSVTTAYQEIQRLSSLLKDYRSFARPQRLSMEPTDLCQILRETFAAIVRGQRTAAVRLEFDFEKDLPLVPADRQKMQQVVVNLGKNAVEAMRDGGILSAKCYRRNERIVFEISDTGLGLPEGVDVFQLFKTTKPDGTGLGLPIVQQIVSEHRGTIDYESVPGQGTTFKVSLPLSTKRTPASPAKKRGV